MDNRWRVLRPIPTPSLVVDPADAHRVPTVGLRQADLDVLAGLGLDRPADEVR